MSLTGYLYTLQVICTAQVTCLVHIYEPNRIFAHLHVICTVQITCLVRIYQRIELLAISMYISIQYPYYFQNKFVRLTGYLYSTSNLFNTHL